MLSKWLLAMVMSELLKFFQLEKEEPTILHIRWISNNLNGVFVSFFRLFSFFFAFVLVFCYFCRATEERYT